LSYKVATTRSDNKVYDPFKVLGVGYGNPEKKSNPITINFCSNSTPTKLAVNQTLKEANEYFVQFTKAYRSLTDPEIRKN
jgi:translocation protein SEC63